MAVSKEQKASVIAMIEVHGLSPSEVARATGLTLRTIQRWVKDESDSGGTVQRVAHKAQIEHGQIQREDELLSELTTLVVDGTKAINKLTKDILMDTEYVKEHIRDCAPLFQLLADHSYKVLEGFARAREEQGKHEGEGEFPDPEAE